MMRIDTSLITPIYVKNSETMPWPNDPVFYLLSSNNLYLCRNHQYFKSCVPAPRWPTELAPHTASLVTDYPPIPQDQIERICGFFGHMSDEYGAEAIALFAWDKKEETVRTIVPLQVSAVGQGAWGKNFPIGVKYKFPQDLPEHWTVFCDIHSHCELEAYASSTDIHDENSFTGIHIVVGRLDQDPPEFHVEGVVDEARFPCKWEDVITGYDKQLSFPSKWLDQIAITNYTTFQEFDFNTVGGKWVTEYAMPTTDANHPGHSR